jgi:hypothetical protein
MPTFRNDFNSATPDIPFEAHLKTPAEAYDLNYNYPVMTLRSDRVELRPFIASHSHSTSYALPDLFYSSHRYMPNHS